LSTGDAQARKKKRTLMNKIAKQISGLLPPFTKSYFNTLNEINE
jgi:hypothetical protein